VAQHSTCCTAQGSEHQATVRHDQSAERLQAIVLSAVRRHDAAVCHLHLVRDVVLYLSEFGDRFHHPCEDAAIQRMVASSALKQTANALLPRSAVLTSTDSLSTADMYMFQLLTRVQLGAAGEGLVVAEAVSKRSPSSVQGMTRTRRSL
jgi:hypothetical protein